MARKLTHFLKDESAAAAIEYVLLACGIAVAIITAVKPASYSRACPVCGRPMRQVTVIAKFGRHPELRAHECRHCQATVMEEWSPQESVSSHAHLWGRSARTCADRLTVLRKKLPLSDLEIVLIFATWVGSIVFGWKQQPYWLGVPPLIFIGYALFLLDRHRAWASRALGVGSGKIFEMWKSSRVVVLALFTSLRNSRSAGVAGRSQKNRGNIPRRDLVLETICPGSFHFFSPEEMVF
jgi:Flp/Fap pilin component